MSVYVLYLQGHHSHLACFFIFFTLCMWSIVRATCVCVRMSVGCIVQTNMHHSSHLVCTNVVKTNSDNHVAITQQDLRFINKQPINNYQCVKLQTFHNATREIIMTQANTHLQKHLALTTQRTRSEYTNEQQYLLTTPQWEYYTTPL